MKNWKTIMKNKKIKNKSDNKKRKNKILNWKSALLTGAPIKFHLP